MKKIIIKKDDAVNRQYSTVIAVSNVIMCAICIVILLSIMFAWFQQYIREEMAKMSYNQLDNTCQTVQSKLSAYQVQLQNLFQEADIKASLYSDEEDLLKEFSISRYLNCVIVNDESVDYAVIYKNDEIKQIAGPVYPGKEEQEKIVECLKNSQNDNEIFFWENEKNSIKHLFMFRTERNKLSGPPQRGLLLAINQKKLAESLFGQKDKTQNVWVFDDAGNILLEQNETKESITENVRKQIEETDASGTREIHVDGKKYFLVVMKNTDFHLNFAQILDESEISRTLKRVMVIALICVAAVLTFCSVAAYAAARFIMYPLKEFFRTLAGAAGLNEKNGENDQLTRITSERILSEISSMSRQFHKDKVLGYLEDASCEDLPPNSLQLEKNGKQAVLMYVGSKIGKIPEKELDLLSHELNRVFPTEITVEMYLEENRNYCVFIPMEPLAADVLADRSKFQEKLRVIFQNIGISGCSFYAICSGVIQNQEALQPEFKRLKQLSKYVLFGDFETVSSSMDYSSKKTDEISKKSFSSILDVVKQGDDVRAKSMMPALLADISQYEIKSIFPALSSLASEIEQIYFQFSDLSRSYQETYLEHYIKLTSLINQKELYDYFSNIIEDACLEIRTSKERSIRTIMLDSIRYIEEHFQDPGLSVDQIAAEFHISNSYFSRMFHEICSLSFPEYVNELRLNYSVQLLETTNVSIKEVSGRSGFSSVSYFGVQFKKKYGVSPSAYRQKQR